MVNHYEFRFVNKSDCLQCLEVYKPYVIGTDITFDYEVPVESEYTHKIEDISSNFPWLVCTYDNKVIGYAYASKLRVKAAYQWTVESTIYFSKEHQGKGIARLMYKGLFEILKLLGYYNVYAGIALPNEVSESFHRSLGFYDVGTYKNIGYKRGKWHDVLWLQLHLAMHVDKPESPTSICDPLITEKIQTILTKYNNALTKKTGSAGAGLFS